MNLRKPKQEVASLPQTVYVFLEEDVAEEPFLIACADLKDTVNPGEKRLVGRYELATLGTAESVVTLEADL